MKKIAFLISAFIGLLSCESGINISVSNPSDFDRIEIVEIPAEKLMNLSVGKAFVVSDKNGEILPSQFTYDDKLIFQTNIKAKETISYIIKTGAPENFPAITYGRFITERKDDFAWENDRVAFRIYGPALIPIDGPSNGLDFWYKRTSDLIIDKWYKEDIAGVKSYHEDHGEGLDDYKVGRTLGGGMMAPFFNESLTLNDNFVSQEVLENGPLRTTFKLIYKDITVDGKTFGESRIFSIDAGSQLTKVTQEFCTKDVITVAAGIIKRSEDGEVNTVYTDNGDATIFYEEPASEKVGRIFVCMYFPKGINKSITHTATIINSKSQKEETHSHVLGVMTYQPEQPITYFTGYGWDKFGFPTLNDFQNHIGLFSIALKEPLIIKYL